MCNIGFNKVYLTRFILFLWVRKCNAKCQSLSGKEDRKAVTKHANMRYVCLQRRKSLTKKSFSYKIPIFDSNYDDVMPFAANH